MGRLVTNGALCRCSMGVAPCPLMVLPLNRVTGCALPAATVMDHIPFLNLASFGLCRSLLNPLVAAATTASFGVLTPAPCLPVLPLPWSPGSIKTKIRSLPALTDQSVLSCVYGGMIKIDFPGQVTIGLSG